MLLMKKRAESMVFLDELEKKLQWFVEQLSKNFEICPEHQHTRMIKVPNKYGYSLQSDIYQSRMYDFPEYAFKFGFDGDETETGHGRSFIVANKKMMEYYSKKSLAAFERNMLGLIARIKLENAWGIWGRWLGPDGPPAKAYLLNGLFFDDYCCSEGGGSVDYGWYVPYLHLFVEHNVQLSFREHDPYAEWIPRER
jgi:hypothetical protein